MKKQLHSLFAIAMFLVSFNLQNSFAQSYNLIQTFEDGGSGTDACWTGYNGFSVPSTSDFFTTVSPVHSGSFSGGMYSCCGGAANNLPTYYISPVISNGAHTVKVFLRQSSFFNEGFEIGTVSDVIGSNFTAGLTISTWPSVPAWQLTSTQITTNAVNNRVAFRVPPASLKTYYLDSLIITNSGNATATCNYVSVGVNEINKETNQVKIYPNPADDQITIESETLPIKEVKIIDLMGKTMYHSMVNQNRSKIDVSYFTPGIYFVQITDDQKNMANKKIVIQ
jgi:hypothetical protein